MNNKFEASKNLAAALEVGRLFGVLCDRICAELRTVSVMVRESVGDNTCPSLGFKTLVSRHEVNDVVTKDRLKAEDSGEEEEETFRPAPKPGEGEHPLQYNYALWFSKRFQTNKTVRYDQNLKFIASFASVEQFWNIYSYIVRPGDMSGHVDYHLFKEGIRPMWEDEANKHGGKWVIRLKKGLASRCWENLILAMLGEQFMVGEEICGAVISIRFQDDILSLWNRSNDHAIISRIKETLQRVLNLPPNTIMEYKAHTDSMKDNTSFRNTDLFMR